MHLKRKCVLQSLGVRSINIHVAEVVNCAVRSATSLCLCLSCSSIGGRGGVLQSPAISTELSGFPFHPVKFCFIYFETRSFDAHTLGFLCVLYGVFRKVLMAFCSVHWDVSSFLTEGPLLLKSTACDLPVTAR